MGIFFKATTGNGENTAMKCFKLYLDMKAPFKCFGGFFPLHSLYYFQLLAKLFKFHTLLDFKE